ncbi:MAG TPA: hypothetical protein PLI18_02285 [Pirellulaceae bacterium]|nr:hypothetical protein [Pirellulaceae bacterium]
MRGRRPIAVLILLLPVPSTGCLAIRCRPIGPDCAPAALASGASAAAMSDASMSESTFEEPTIEEPTLPHPRFHPVPAWDVFHPPVDLAVPDLVPDPTCRPFFLVPAVERQPRELPRD